MVVAVLVCFSGCIGSPADQSATPTPEQQTPASTSEPNETGVSNGTSTAEKSHVTVRGVISQRPRPLSNPLVKPATIEPVMGPHITTFVVQSVTEGPVQLRNRTVLVEYTGFAPDINTSDGAGGPGRGDILHLEGTYNPDRNRIAVDGPGARDAFSVVGTNASVRRPPIVGRERDTVGIGLQNFGDGLQPGDTVTEYGYRADDGTTVVESKLRIEDNGTATVTVGSVRYGEAFLKSFGEARVVVTEQPG